MPETYWSDERLSHLLEHLLYRLDAVSLTMDYRCRSETLQVEDHSQGTAFAGRIAPASASGCNGLRGVAGN
ncbi:MAG: hypothetical protein ACRDUT_00420 [Mycobacterium sp.]